MRYFLLLVFTFCTAAFGAGQNILFILDGSGSMWGQVDGEAKIEVAREVMGELIGELPEEARVGLMAYGHRRKGDCGDIELLVPLGPLKRGKLTSAVSGIVPKGKTPITASVKLAVEQVRQLEATTTIILVSDGRESCDGDPCDAVRAAKRAGVDFRLHVVGFDLGEEKIDELECMAKEGGGEYFSATNAEELAGALEQAVEASPGLVLEVTSNGEPTPARVFIYKSGTEEEVARDALGASPEKDNPIRLELAPGNYDAKVVPSELDGEPTRLLTDLVISEKGDLRRSVDFSDGGIELTVTTNGEPLKSSTYVFESGTENEVTRESTDDEGLAKYTLVPGTYDIRVRPRGVDLADHFIEAITVTVGETTERSVDLPSGGIELTVTSNGESLKAGTYVLESGTGKEVARESSRDEGVAKYTLAPGTYDIRVRPSGVDLPERLVKGVVVAAGELTERSIDFSEGNLSVRTTVNGAPSKASTYVYKTGTDKEVARESTRDEGVAEYTLPPGEYDIRVRPRDIDAPSHHIKDVTVKAGETTEEAIDFSSGSAQLTVTANGEPLKASTYLLNAETGKEAARDSTDDEGVARYSVPVGEYRIKVRPRGIDAPDHYIEGVAVTAGETTEHTLDIPSGQVVLTVTNRGEPLDARTYIHYAESGKEASRDSTNDEGVARYTIPVGEYRIKIRPDGIDAPDHYLKDITVNAGETTRASFDFAELETAE